MKRSILALLLVAYCAIGTGVAQAQTKRAGKTKITRAKAQAIALRRAAGKVESSELEKERGKLVYSFDIRNAKGTITEVQVEAYTGKIVSVEEENAAQEAAEKKEDNRPRRQRKP